MAMAKCKKTGKKLASETGLHNVTVSALLNNRTDPKPETAAKIAVALNTTPGALGWEVGQ